MKTPTHLHWLYIRGPAGLRGVRLAASMCGLGGLSPDKVTAFREDCDCKECLDAAARDTRTVAPAHGTKQ